MVKVSSGFFQRRRGFDFSRIQNAPFASQLKNNVCVCILKQVL